MADNKKTQTSSRPADDTAGHGDAAPSGDANATRTVTLREKLQAMGMKPRNSSGKAYMLPMGVKRDADKS